MQVSQRLKNIRGILILFFGLLQSLILNSQVAEYYSYNTQWGGIRHFIKTNDNGLAVLSYVNGVVVLRTDSSGAIIWQKRINYTDNEFAYEIAQTTDGGFVILASQIPGVIVAIKLSSAGNTLWAKSFLNGYYDMTVASTGDNAVVFTTGGGCDGSNHLFKVDSIGNIEWQKWYTVLSSTWRVLAKKIIVDDHGNSIVGGVVYPDTNGYYGGYMMSVNPSGGLNWFHEYDLGFNSSINNLIQTSDGNYLVVGEKFITDTNCFVYLMAADSTGVPIWCKTYASNNQFSQVEGITELLDESIVLSGNTLHPSPIYQQGLLFRVDSVGNLIWSLSEGNRNFNELGSDYFHDVVASHHHWFYMSGDYQDGVTMSYLNDTIGLCNPAMEPLNITTSSVFFSSPSISVFDDSYSFQTISAVGSNPNWSKITICSTDTSGPGLSLEEQILQDFEIYPNPCKNQFTLRHNFGHDLYSVWLFDVFGQQVQAYLSSYSPNDFYLHNIPSGVYFLLIRCDGRFYNKKLIVECE